MLNKRSHLSYSFMVMCAVASCSGVTQQGTLTVRHLDQGSYEIYKIASESPLQFVSEQTGQFNEPMKLSPGSYLVLADCSSQIVNVYPGSTNSLTAHKINFVPMQPPTERDKFSIQCLRSERTHSRQHLINHFSLAVLAGTRDLLVGMVPLQVKLEDKDDQPSRLVSFPLSSVAVEHRTKQKEIDGAFEYFVSPTSEMAPYTESQTNGNRLYLLKGQYQIQLNGTSTAIELAEGEGRTVIPASLRITTSSQVDLDRAAKIKGTPLYLEVNGEHFLNLNTSYAVLPGSIQIRLSTTLKPTSVLAKEGENINLHAKNVMVSLGCADNDWSCLGSRKVRLFEKGKSYPFAESVTEVPVLYLRDNIAVGIEGSRNIKYELGNADDQRLKVGFVEIEPTPMHKPGLLTDLVRVESAQAPLNGSSLDLPLDKSTVLPLIVGTYHLSQYTFFTSDGSRRKTSVSVQITQGEKVKIPITTYLSEKRMSALNPEQTSPEEKNKSAQ